MSEEAGLLKSDGNAACLAWSAVSEPTLGSGLFYTVGRDVTAEQERAAELVAAQEALRQSQKMEAVGQLTGGLARFQQSVGRHLRKSR